jgi:iron complex outermembrane receptor protein
VGNVGDGAHGDHEMGNIDYWAVRVSAVADLTPDLENYLIASYSNSKSNGVQPKVTKCYPGVIQSTIPFGDLSCDQVARQSKFDFWTTSNRLPNHRSDIEQWQVINTTTWTASDSLTVKNIFSYAEFRSNYNLDLYGNYMIVGGVTPGSETPANLVGFAFTTSFGGGTVNAQSTMVEEIQFQGKADEGRFVWQAGLYAELNDPLGFSGVQSASFTPCTDVQSFNCVGFTPGQSVGSGAFSVNKTKFRGYAVYGQASYDLTDQLKVTGGLRYTWDKMDVQLNNFTARYGTALALRCSNVSAPGYSGLTTFPYSTSQRFEACRQNLSQRSEAPTWIVGLDYKPIDPVLLYVKYSRGYRQGGITIFGADPLQKYNPEKVDTYETGVKASWRGVIPGNFNVSGFYNNFTSQQLSYGLTCDSNWPNFTVPCAANTALINAGKSELYGLEAELSLSPFRGFRIDASYGYLHTNLKSITTPTVPAPYNRNTPPMLGTILNSLPHKVVVQAGYTLPLPDSVGRFTVSGTYAYSSAIRTAQDQVPGSGNGIVPASNLFNLNATWEDIGGLPVDASFFVTNLTNAKVYLNANDNQPRGFVAYNIGEPRIWGARLRYKFGE